MTHIDATEARQKFSATLDRVAHRGERIVLERHGRPQLALVPIADLEKLERLEDEDDRRAVQRARADAARHGTIPWAKVRAEIHRRPRTKRK
jgi:prevent-host-death family protein